MRNSLILIESILLESKMDDAIIKHKLFHDYKEKALVVYKEIGSKPKYCDFICKNIKYSRYSLTNLIEFFEQNVQRLEEKDINKYDHDSLVKKMQELGQSKASQKADIFKEAPIVWQSSDKKVTIRNILSWEAAKKYGAGTRWC